jgi:hypothetical protein
VASALALLASGPVAAWAQRARRYEAAAFRRCVEQSSGEHRCGRAGRAGSPSAPSPVPFRFSPRPHNLQQFAFVGSFFLLGWLPYLLPGPRT